MSQVNDSEEILPFLRKYAAITTERIIFAPF